MRLLPRKSNELKVTFITDKISDITGEYCGFDKEITIYLGSIYQNLTRTTEGLIKQVSSTIQHEMVHHAQMQCMSRRKFEECYDKNPWYVEFLTNKQCGTLSELPLKRKWHELRKEALSIIRKIP